MTILHNHRQQVTTARMAGLWYLCLAVSGIFGFLIYHPQIFDAADPQKTLTNLIDLESLARTRILLEFAIIVSQALTAVWFYRLFRSVDEWAAWTVGIWGMVNSVAILVSAISMGSAIDIATTSTLATEEKVVMIELLSSIGRHAWGVGSLFFGLWLIPMGYTVTSSKRMPMWLGRLLILGGIGYIIGTVIAYLGIDTPIKDYVAFPATIAEFWMIGYLLMYGIRPEGDGVEK